MAEPIKINTGKYQKSNKIDIDGMIWTVKLPGAATEMRMSQAQRRITLLDKKIEAGEATEADLDRYDTYEAELYNVFRNMFKDGTKDNNQVNKWIDETPMSIIVQAFEDIKDGQPDTSTESE